MYIEYLIGLWGTRYDIKPITLTDIEVDIVDMTYIADTDRWLLEYKILTINPHHNFGVLV